MWLILKSIVKLTLYSFAYEYEWQIWELARNVEEEQIAHFPPEKAWIGDKKLGVKHLPVKYLPYLVL